MSPDEWLRRLHPEIDQTMPAFGDGVEHGFGQVLLGYPAILGIERFLVEPRMVDGRHGAPADLFAQPAVGLREGGRLVVARLRMLSGRPCATSGTTRTDVMATSRSNREAAAGSMMWPRLSARGGRLEVCVPARQNLAQRAMRADLIDV